MHTTRTHVIAQEDDGAIDCCRQLETQLRPLLWHRHFVRPIYQALLRVVLTHDGVILSVPICTHLRSM